MAIKSRYVTRAREYMYENVFSPLLPACEFAFKDHEAALDNDYIESISTSSINAFIHWQFHSYLLSDDAYNRRNANNVEKEYEKLQLGMQYLVSKTGCGGIRVNEINGVLMVNVQHKEMRVLIKEIVFTLYKHFSRLFGNIQLAEFVANAVYLLPQLSQPSDRQVLQSIVSGVMMYFKNNPQKVLSSDDPVISIKAYLFRDLLTSQHCPNIPLWYGAGLSVRVSENIQEPVLLDSESLGYLYYTTVQVISQDLAEVVSSALYSVRDIIGNNENMTIKAYPEIAQSLAVLDHKKALSLQIRRKIFKAAINSLEFRRL